MRKNSPPEEGWMASFAKRDGGPNAKCIGSLEGEIMKNYTQVYVKNSNEMANNDL
jgi:hypothetical protein